MEVEFAVAFVQVIRHILQFGSTSKHTAVLPGTSYQCFVFLNTGWLLGRHLKSWTFFPRARNYFAQEEYDMGYD